MHPLDIIRRRVQMLLASQDPLDRRTGRVLAESTRTLYVPPFPRGGGTVRPSGWRHVDLRALLQAFGNSVTVVGDRLKSGHAPVHGSRSGTCLVAWPSTGRWWCSSCRQAGDAAGLVMGAHACTYAEAAAWLEARYGPPAGLPPHVIRRRLGRRCFTTRTPS
jgi:hypothetical protein